MAIGYQAFKTIPYCGLPPSPESLLSRWTLDPFLIAALLAVACLYAIGCRTRPKVASVPARWSFYVGWMITALALISPLCPLSVSLFSARVGQHMILLFIGAPLVAVGRPLAVIAALWPQKKLALPAATTTTLSIATTIFTVAMWFWHAPWPYTKTFESSTIYWAMHLSLYGAAFWLWTLVLVPSGNRGMHCVIAAAVSSLQISFLAALITFAPQPLYAPHALTTAAWGLTPLQDQQLAGAILWVPGMLVFIAAAMVMLWLGMTASLPNETSRPDAGATVDAH